MSVLETHHLLPQISEHPKRRPRFSKNIYIAKGYAASWKHITYTLSAQSIIQPLHAQKTYTIHAPHPTNPSIITSHDRGNTALSIPAPTTVSLRQLASRLRRSFSSSHPSCVVVIKSQHI
jgi:hypothetical protein